MRGMRQAVSPFSLTKLTTLIRRMGTTQNGKPYDFFGCSGFPKCKAKYEVKDSKPV